MRSMMTLDADAGGPAAGEIERAVALRRVVDDNEKFRLVAGLGNFAAYGSSVISGGPPPPVRGARARPEWCHGAAFVHKPVPRAVHSGENVGIEPPAQLRTKADDVLDGAHGLGRDGTRPIGAVHQDAVEMGRVLHEALHLGPDRSEPGDREVDQRRLEGRELRAAEIVQDLGLGLVGERRENATRLSASGRFSRPFSSCGSGRGRSWPADLSGRSCRHRRSD